MKNILLIEDEERLRRVLKLYLENEGLKVYEAGNGREGAEMFSPSLHSLVLLDVMLPEMDGWSVLRTIRKKSNVPVIMITARGEEEDRLFGFELGADDYVVKPLSPREVTARVKAVLKRSENCSEKPENLGKLTINAAGREVYIDGDRLDLTPKEYELLDYLAERRGIALSREQILDAVWGYEYFGDLRTVDTHIKNLREKLKDGREYIQTVRGIGYKFEVQK